MYIVEIQNDNFKTEIHGLQNKLKSGGVVKGINCIDSFSFSILPNNPGFDLLFDFQTLVTVYNTNKNRYDFRGRVLCSSPAMDDKGLISKEVTCESFFGFLCDSVQKYVEEKNWTVRGLLQHIIDTHNAQVEDYKKFTIGEVSDDLDPNNNLYVGIQRENTWKTIEEKLVKKLGGEIQFRVVDGVLYLDYLKKIGATRTTKIELSRNMKAITKENDPTAYITRLIPLGCKLTKEVINTDEEGNETVEAVETEERLTIEGVNNGKEYIDDTTAIEVYGIHAGYIEFDDVTDSANLLRKGQEWLAENNKVQVKYSITWLDLSLLGIDFDDCNVHDYHPIVNPLLGIDDTARIIKKNIDICDEVKSTIEVGDNFKTLSEIQREQADKIAGVADNVTKIEHTTNDLKDKVSSVEKKVNKIEGIDGVHFYVMYSQHADGHDMTDVPDENTLYMGTCSTSEATAPTDHTKYTWVRVGGKDGEPGKPGPDGKTQYLHIKYSDDGKTFTPSTESPEMRDFESWQSGKLSEGGTVDNPNIVEASNCITYKPPLNVTPGMLFEASTYGGNYSALVLVGCECYDIDGNWVESNVVPQYHDISFTVPSNVYFVRLYIDGDVDAETFEMFRSFFINGNIIPTCNAIDAGSGETIGAWIGTLVDFNEEDSMNFDDYTWKKFTEDVDEELEEIRQTVEERYTSAINTAEAIILSAVESCVQTSNYEQFKATVSSQLAVLANEISMNFTTTTEQITNVDGDIQTKFTQLYKYIKFSGETAITIGSSNNAITLEIDNEKGIVFKKNGVQFGLWDGENFYTGNIIINVNERAQLGNFAFVPRSDGSLSFLKVGA